MLEEADAAVREAVLAAAENDELTRVEIAELVGIPRSSLYNILGADV